jgi:hypothetical protein
MGRFTATDQAELLSHWHPIKRFGILLEVRNRATQPARKGQIEGLEKGAPKRTMTLLSSSRGWGWLCGAAALAAVALATLMPEDWVPRLGVHWLVEHFVGYFALTAIVCIAWPRPLPVAAVLMVLAGVLEALQGATVDRTPDVLSALSGAGGVLTAALLVWSISRFRKLALSGRNPGSRETETYWPGL